MRTPDPQQRFDQLYITSTEIQTEVGVTRTSIMYARKRGTLPEPIVVNGGQVMLWEREIAKPFIDAWKEDLCKRGRGG